MFLWDSGDRSTSNVCGMHLKTWVTVCSSECFGCTSMWCEALKSTIRMVTAGFIRTFPNQRASVQNKRDIRIVLHILIPKLLIEACLRETLVLHFNPSSPSLLILHFAGTVRLPFSNLKWAPLCCEISNQFPLHKSTTREKLIADGPPRTPAMWYVWYVRGKPVLHSPI